MSHDIHQVRSFEHPGEGRKRAKSTPKGRQVDPQAAEEIAVLLGDRPRRRDLLIEHLHLIQDKYRQISAAHLAALADEMKLAFAEVFETATFYAHFDVVKEGENNIAPLTIRVCDSLTCAMLGAEKLLQELQESAGPGIRVVRAPCVGRCDTAPAAITSSITLVLQACLQPPRAAISTPICLTTSITTPMSPAAAISCCSGCAPASFRGKIF
jgi:NADH:ubiquinone oxidoreductase subunit E